MYGLKGRLPFYRNLVRHPRYGFEGSGVLPALDARPRRAACPGGMGRR